MDPVVMLRLVHDLQQTVMYLENANAELKARLEHLARAGDKSADDQPL